MALTHVVPTASAACSCADPQHRAAPDSLLRTKPQQISQKKRSAAQTAELSMTTSELRTPSSPTGTGCAKKSCRLCCSIARSAAEPRSAAKPDRPSAVCGVSSKRNAGVPPVEAVASSRCWIGVLSGRSRGLPDRANNGSNRCVLALACKHAGEIHFAHFAWSKRRCTQQQNVACAMRSVCSADCSGRADRQLLLQPLFLFGPLACI